MQNHRAFKIAIYYFLFGILWIVLSDQVVEVIVSNGHNLTSLQTIKGIFFVLATALFLYSISQKYITKLETQAEKNKLFLDNIKGLVISLDRDGKIMFINREGQNLLQCFGENCIGVNFIDVFIPLDKRETVKKWLTKHLEGEVLSEEEFICPVVSKYGNEVIISWSCNVLTDKDSKKYLLCAGIDITSKIEVEKIANKMLYVVEQSPNSVMITDTDGNLEYVNKKFVELTGYSFEEVKGKNPRILKSGKTPPEVYQELWQKITNGMLWEGEFCNKKKNGELYWEYAKIAPLRDPVTGAIVNFIGIKEDITYQKKLEAELLHSQKMEAIGNLAGGIAHDFNNILTAIIGYANVLLLKISEPSLRLYAEQILSASERAATLTKNLLTFARKQPSIKKVININEVINNFVRILKRIIGEHIELKTKLEERDFYVYADPIQIEQVLINLATNARDAMENGGSLVIETKYFVMDDTFITKHGFGKKGEYVQLKVSDTGIGMDEHTRSHIFEPFFTTKEVGKGTGLGLAIVYGIVKDSNGFITVESEVGRGTTFYIYFPLTKKDESFSEEKKVEIEFGDHKGVTILLAEDDGFIREILRDYLEGFGHKVLTAKDGEEAIEIFKKFRDEISLCILDIVMPKKNGIDVYKETKSLKSKLKTILMTGYKIEIEKEVFPFDKDVRFVQKPISPQLMLKTVRDLIDK